MSLTDSLLELKGVGPELAKKLEKLGLRTIGELIEYYPRGYDDYSTITPIKQLRPGIVSIQATVAHATGRYARRGMHITEAVANDDSGSVRLIWFNQPYRATALKAGTAYYISGEYVFRSQRLSILNPSVELVSDFPINTARIVPRYRETKGLTSFQIRKLLKALLGEIRTLPETLPQWIIQEEQFISRSEATEMMHFPASSEYLRHAKRRLGFEEIFQLSLAACLNKKELGKEVAVSVPFDQTLAKEFVSHLPFALTNDQRRAIWSVLLDLQKSQPMNRLIEGDVGSGKTVVAAMAAVMVLAHGYQVAFMAPTELLARQHYESVVNLLKPLGMDAKVGLLIGGLSTKEKSALHKEIKSGDVLFIIGTHALIQDAVDMHALSFVIIDEQHRFGVEQRKKLQAKAGHAVHVLSTTATPIPRSLALTLYGELDISVIKAMPVGRKPVKTEIVSPNSKSHMYDQISLQLDIGRQMFVVCPLIDDSSESTEKSIQTAYTELKRQYPAYPIAQLHGKMKSAEKERVMRDFLDKKIMILVSTTVIEVGVDVPNATVMLIENAERFGLAQIHQLRGRVGRSNEQGFCYLVTSDSSTPSPRLRALQTSNDGFRLAELDLAIRGPGAIYGIMQHGQLDLQVAKLSDVSLIQSARERAKQFIDKSEHLLQYKELHHKVSKLRAVTNLN